MARFTPRPSQLPAIKHLLTHKRCGLFKDMGMGKTVSVLTAMDIASLTEDDVFPVLVLAPKRVVTDVWATESQKWDHLKHLRTVPIIGDNLQQRTAALEQPGEVYAINYEMLPWLVEHFGALWPFKTIIADECTRLKSFRVKQGGKRARALAKVAHTLVKRFIIMTGTPASQGLQDLWGPMWMVDAGKRLEKSYTQYMNRWFRKETHGHSLAHDSFSNHIFDRISDVCLTIRAEDYYDLQEPIVSEVRVDMPERANGIYKRMLRELIAEVEGGTITAVNAAVKSSKLLQIGNGAAYIDPEVLDDKHPKSKKYKVIHDAKLDALESIYNEAGGNPLLVSYTFRSDRERIKQRFKFAVDIRDHENTVNDWNAGKIPMLLAHPRSAGHGLNLQYGGNRLVFFSHTWSLEETLQITERIGPMRQMQAGFNRPFYVYLIVANKSLDDTVIARGKSNKSIQDALKEYLSTKNK